MNPPKHDTRPGTLPDITFAQEGSERSSGQVGVPCHSRGMQQSIARPGNRDRVHACNVCNMVTAKLLSTAKVPFRTLLFDGRPEMRDLR